MAYWPASQASVIWGIRQNVIYNLCFPFQPQIECCPLGSIFSYPFYQFWCSTGLSTWSYSLVYINNLPDKVLSQLAMYADDLTLYCISPNSSNTSRREVGVSLNNDLDSVRSGGNDWLVHVTFNAKKTKLLSLSRSRDDTFPSIHMGPSTLPEVSDFHLLGLDISTNVS